MIIKSRKDRRIANQKKMIEHRDELIGLLQSQKDELKEENKILSIENSIGNKALMTLEELYKLIVGNKYENDEIVNAKIKELVLDYHSQN